MEIMFEKCLRDLLVKRGKTQSELLINFMNGSDFDSVRDRDWFKEVEQELFTYRERT